MIIGAISALINGMTVPLSALIASKLYQNFTYADTFILV
jgi:hypothetical protein